MCPWFQISHVLNKDIALSFLIVVVVIVVVVVHQNLGFQSKPSGQQCSSQRYCFALSHPRQILMINCSCLQG